MNWREWKWGPWVLGNFWSLCWQVSFLHGQIQSYVVVRNMDHTHCKKSLSRLNQRFFAPGQKCPLPATRAWLRSPKVSSGTASIFFCDLEGHLESWEEMLIAEERWCSQLPPSQTVEEASKVVKPSLHGLHIYFLNESRRHRILIKII